MPSIQAIADNITASDKYWVINCILLAPKALRTPTSLPLRIAAAVERLVKLTQANNNIINEIMLNTVTITALLGGVKLAVVVLSR